MNWWFFAAFLSAFIGILAIAGLVVGYVALPAKDTPTGFAVLLDWLLQQITPLSCILFALLLVVAYKWGFAEAALRALSAHCGGPA